MTRGDLIRHIGLEFGLDTTTGSDEQLLLIDWANEAVRDLLLETRCHVEIGDQALTIGVNDYRVDANVMEVDFRTIQANPFRLQIVSTDEMYDYRNSFPATTPEVTRIAIQGDLLMVWPTPTSATTLRYIYVAKPTEMTSDSHDPSNTTYGGVPTQYHFALLSYMRWRAAMYDERKVPHTPDQYHQQYLEAVRAVRKRLRRMSGMSRGMIAGYPGTGANPGRRNDIYPAS